MQREGLIRHLGVSNVNAEQVAEARSIAPIVCVQNNYNVAHRVDDALVDELAADGIGFVPYFPLGGFSPLQSDRLDAVAARLQEAFLRHGAAQCGICTPGMLVAAVALLSRNERPSETEVLDAIGGVLCRCTGYRKIIAAILDVANEAQPEVLPEGGGAIGARIRRLDGLKKVRGADIFGADEAPADALVLKAVRSPYHRAAFTFGDIDAFLAVLRAAGWSGWLVVEQDTLPTTSERFARAAEDQRANRAFLAERGL